MSGDRLRVGDLHRIAGIDSRSHGAVVDFTGALTLTLTLTFTLTRRFLSSLLLLSTGVWTQAPSSTPPRHRRRC